jgi:hypothetical protein
LLLKRLLLAPLAVIGRSNVGKSSLINMLTGRNSLAMVSKTPGALLQRGGSGGGGRRGRALGAAAAAALDLGSR